MRTDSFALLATAALLTACSRGAPPAPPQPTVAVSVPLAREVTDWDDYVGRFTATDDVEVRPRVSGNIERVLFREGVDVGRGQALFTIDARPYRAALAQAEAELARARARASNARTEAARAGTLLAAQAISKEEFEAKQANLRSADADVGAARAALNARALDVGFTVVRSPIAGRVSDKRVTTGSYVASGQTVLTRVVSIDPIRFSFDGAESLYLKYARLDATGERRSSRYEPNPVDIKLADEPTYRWRGRMAFIDNAIDPRSGAIRAFALVPNPNGFLVPGMFGRARLLGSGSYTAMLIPDEAIVTDQTRKSVFVVGRDGKTAVRLVETGPLVEGLRVVRTGLTANDRVVLDGLARLQPGIAVNVKTTKITPRAAADAPVSGVNTAPPASEAVAR